MPDTIFAQRDAAAKAADELVKETGGKLDDNQSERLMGLVEQVKGFDAQIEKSRSDQALLEQVKSLGGRREDAAPGGHADVAAKTIGEHFVKHVGEQIKSRDGGRFAFSAPEWGVKERAGDGSDAIVTGGPSGSFADWTTEIDRTVQREKRERLVIADLLGSGSISGTAIKYYVEGAFEGAFETVAEGGAKPQVSMSEPTPVIDTVKKIAAWIHLSDETLEDIPFFVSEINNRLMYELAAMEEQQILAGDGAGANLLGLLNRDGVQVETADAAADNADAIFRATTKIQNATDLLADGIVIHPLDYQDFRLSRDGNGQYFGGGYFEGQSQPPLWGLNTVVSPVVERGKPLVGNFKQSSTLYRKGGVRVETTNTDADDFTNNMAKTRVEERIALAVRQPLALVKVTLGS